MAVRVWPVPEQRMFGINTAAVKSAFTGFEQNTAALPPSTDPWVRAIAAFILALAKAFGE